jgi:DNA-binding transcriptional ArsR family regulator
VVVDQLSPGEVDRIFGALADATRRDIVRRVLSDEASISDLATRYAMTWAAVQKHVAVLERAGLVTKRTRGRERMVLGDVDTIREAVRLLDELEEVWRGRIARIDTILGPDPEPHPTPTTQQED